jgi:hypothetical protein
MVLLFPCDFLVSYLSFKKGVIKTLFASLRGNNAKKVKNHWSRVTETVSLKNS